MLLTFTVFVVAIGVDVFIIAVVAAGFGVIAIGGGIFIAVIVDAIVFDFFIIAVVAAVFVVAIGVDVLVGCGANSFVHQMGFVQGWTVKKVKSIWRNFLKWNF